MGTVPPGFSVDEAGTGAAVATAVIVDLEAMLRKNLLDKRHFCGSTSILITIA
jgi:hypothetical protein